MPEPGLRPADADFESRIRASFARQGTMAYLGAQLEEAAPGRVVIGLPFRTLTVCRLDAFVEKAGRSVHCATGVQTLMCVVGRSGVTG